MLSLIATAVLAGEIQRPVVNREEDVPDGHCAYVVQKDGSAQPVCRRAPLIEVISAFNHLQRSEFVKGGFTGCTLRVTGSLPLKRIEFVSWIATLRSHPGPQVEIGLPEDGATWITCHS